MDDVTVEIVIVTRQDLDLRRIVGNCKECRHHPRTMGSHCSFEEDGNMIDNVTRNIPEARWRMCF